MLSVMEWTRIAHSLDAKGCQSLQADLINMTLATKTLWEQSPR